jgi:DNA-binding protein YbaB
MFNKLKKFQEIRSQAKIMQSALANEKISEEKNGIKVSFNGNLELTELSLNSSLTKEEQERSLKACLNEAIKKTQRLMAKKMQEMGGIPDLS